MSQIVGRRKSIGDSPSPDSPMLRSTTGKGNFSPNSASYYQATVQPVDTINNAAMSVRIASGGARTVPRVLVEDADDTEKLVRLRNNVGGGVLRYIKNDGVPPAGVLQIIGDRPASSAFVALNGAESLELPPNLHRLRVQSAGADAGAKIQILYYMEIFFANIVFLDIPSVSDTLRFGNFVTFEFYAAGDPSTVTAGNIGVEIGVSVAATLANFVTEFNTTYIAAVEPAGGHVADSWAKVISAEDEVIYDDGTNWVDAADNGVQIASSNYTLIYNANKQVGDFTVSKEL